MFKTVRNLRKIRRTVNAVRTHEEQQQLLDALRYTNADRPQMQLHLDRMQTLIDEQMINTIAA